MGTYRVAQICVNGHVITHSADVRLERRQNFCSICGKPTIMQCEECNTSIRGYYYVHGVIGGSSYKKPLYCHNCGDPYPWTKAALESTALMINEDENLNESEKQLFCESLPDLLVESPTPKTNLAVSRFKKFLGKSAKYTADGVRDIFVDVASETIKKSLEL